MADKKIGDTLHISMETVRSHKKNIMEKLGIHKSAEITKYLIDNELP